MNKKLQEMWDSAHEIPNGAYVPENTVLVQLDLHDPTLIELSYYETKVSDYWKGYPKHSPVRSVEPLPDPSDTGVLTVRSEDEEIALVDTYEDWSYELTKSQARNLVRKLTEAIDGH